MSESESLGSFRNYRNPPEMIKPTGRVYPFSLHPQSQIQLHEESLHVNKMLLMGMDMWCRQQGSGSTNVEDSVLTSHPALNLHGATILNAELLSGLLVATSQERSEQSRRKF